MILQQSKEGLLRNNRPKIYSRLFNKSMVNIRLTSGKSEGPSKLASMYLIRSRLSTMMLLLCSKAGTYTRAKSRQGKKYCNEFK